MSTQNKEDTPLDFGLFYPAREKPCGAKNLKSLPKNLNKSA